MKLTGPAADETIGRDEAMKLPGRKDPAACGWVRVERRVRPGHIDCSVNEFANESYKDECD